MEVAIITAIITLIGILGANILQYISSHHKTNADMIVQMLEQALKLNKQELDTTREFNEYLEKKLEKLEARLEKVESERELLKIERDELKDLIEELRKELESCVKKENDDE